jgi:hypothetical protein
MFLGVAASAAAQPTAQPGQLFKWDHPVAQNALVTRFELRIDSGPFTDVGRTLANDTQTPSGMQSFSFVIPALSTGPHTYVVRACPTTGSCAESAPFAFGIVVISAPTGLRIAPPSPDDEDEN